VLTLSERGQRETTRTEIITMLATPKAADHVIESLRHKGWLERASWGAYLLIPAEHGA
jgi:predicted transcriptional regulator of viral defense system